MKTEYETEDREREGILNGREKGWEKEVIQYERERYNS